MNKSLIRLYALLGMEVMKWAARMLRVRKINSNVEMDTASIWHGDVVCSKGFDFQF